MLNRKLLEVLKLLNASEHCRLRLFLQSPYFNNKSNAIELTRLYEYIMTYHAVEEHPKLSKARVSHKFFPEKAFKEGQKGPLDALASDLFSLVKRFMAQSAFEANDPEFEEGLTMAKFYRRFGMEERFWQVVYATRKSQQESTYRDATYFQKQFYLEDEAGSFETLNNRFEDDANVVIAIQNLDIAYAITKLELLCVLSYQQKHSQIIYDIAAPLNQAVYTLPEKYPIVQQHEIYRLVFQLIQHPEDDAAFTTFESLLERHKAEIPFEKVRNLKAYYRFFLGRRYDKSGNSDVRNQIFKVYKAHYEEGYFYEGDAIMINSLKVLVLFGLKLGQFDWVKKVLDEHQPAQICGTKYPVEAHSLCLAEYYFYIKEYQNALNTLIYKHFENPNYSLWAEMLLIKIYFETSDELLEYRMKALDQKVRRTKISTETKQRYYQFLKKLDKIIKYGWGKNIPKRARLMEEIKTTPGIIEREWLLEKLGEGR
jgi:hypothetical protein